MHLYMLPLEDGCYYVGTTVNINKRYNQHAAGTGAAWTKLHPGAYPVLADSQYVPFPGRTDGGRVYCRDAEKIRPEQRKGGLHSPNANVEKASAAPYFTEQLL